MRVTEIDDVVREITQTAQGRARVMIAIAGAPGAGKSTFAAALEGKLADATVLPMDGFHLGNDTLKERGLLERKGAPETFDTGGLVSLIEKVARGGEVSVPTFDRAADRVVPDGSSISADTRIVLVEGNYLLLDAPGWRETQQFWDLTISIEVPLAELERRLMQRWLHYGFSEEEAGRRVQGNDLLNATTIISGSYPAAVVFQQ